MMTVCIATICANYEGVAGAAIILAADRMATMPDYAQFDIPYPKITALGNYCALLWAGDTSRVSPLVQEIERTPGDFDNENIDTIAAHVYEIYKRHRIRRMEAELYGPSGLNLGLYNSVGYPGLNQQQRDVIDMQSKGFKFGVGLIVAGIDSIGARLFVLNDPLGFPEDATPLGATAVGVGGHHAGAWLIRSAHTKDKPIKDTLVTIHLAKQNAELTPGVGKATDMRIITRTHGIQAVDDDVKKSINEVCKKAEDARCAKLSEGLRTLSLGSLMA